MHSPSPQSTTSPHHLTSPTSLRPFPHHPRLCTPRSLLTRHYGWSVAASLVSHTQRAITSEEASFSDPTTESPMKPRTPKASVKSSKSDPQVPRPRGRPRRGLYPSTIRASRPRRGPLALLDLLIRNKRDGLTILFLFGDYAIFLSFAFHLDILIRPFLSREEEAHFPGSNTTCHCFINYQLLLLSRGLAILVQFWKFSTFLIS